jgi:hypothetical protein
MGEKTDAKNIPVRTFEGKRPLGGHRRRPNVIEILSAFLR